jgi:uncharacterized protein (DUF58 family)
MAAFACFLAAFVLPASFPEFTGQTTYLLLAVGCAFLSIAVISVMLRKWMSVIAHKMGIRSRMLLPREGLIYLGIMLIIAIAALTGGNPDTGNMLLLIFGMMSGPFVFNGWIVVAMLARIKVSRHLPESIEAGSWFSVEIRLKNEKRFLSSQLVEVRDSIEGHGIRDEGNVVFVRVAPGSERSAHYDVNIPRRGRYKFGPLRMSSRFPLGIGERGYLVMAPDEVIVHPVVGRLSPAWKRRERELAETTSRANARLGLFNDAFHGIREYRSGDNPRDIHWRSSARHGQFMVKEHEQHRDAEVIVLLDLFSSGDFPESLQERAISLAATICVEQTRRTSSGRYRLMIAGKKLQNVECSGSSRFCDEVLKELALCESSAKAQLAPMLLAVCQSPPSPNSRFVLITPRPETARLLADSVAQENLSHEQLFTGRLMILTADEPTLESVLAFDLPLVVVPTESENGTIPSAEVVGKGRLEITASDRSLSRSDEKLQSTFFRSMTLTAAVAGLILSQSEGKYFPAALIPIVAVAAWVFVDHLKWLRFPGWIINSAGLLAVGVSMYDLRHGTIEDKLLSGAHMLVYLTCIVLLMQKGFRQYWWLIALVLLQMAVAAVLRTGVFFGGSMLLMMALLLWTLSVFSLFRVMRRHSSSKTQRDAVRQPTSFDTASHVASAGNHREKPSILVHDGLQRDQGATWIGWRFRSMVSGSFVVSLVLAALVFAAFPRVWQHGATAFAADLVKDSGLVSTSGFNESVTLGRMGRLALSRERVLSFTVTSLKSQSPISADQLATALGMDEIRFRGVALDHYDRGTWRPLQTRRGSSSFRILSGRLPGTEGLKPEFRIEITQDPPYSGYVFAPYPVVSIKKNDNRIIRLYSRTGAIIWDGEADSAKPRTLTVECPRIESKTQSIGSSPANTPINEFPDNIAEETNHYGRRNYREQNETNSIADDLPRLYSMINARCTKDGRLVSETDRVRLIMDYLSAENGFTYSTVQKRHDLKIDPVEDFLFNTKSGHCEYFASACALMLQAVQVPARLVNGYYGSEVNSVTGRNEIRQQHAHSWVEVFLDNSWQTLEPTPAAPRRAMLAAERSESLMNSLQTAISELWDDRVHNMTAARQKEFFAPVISTSKSLFDTIRQQGLLSTIQNEIQSFLTSPKSLFSWRGGAATFVFLLVFGLIYRLRLFARMLLAARTLLARISGKKRARQSVIRFYAGFCALCESHGMKLSESNTALENGRLAVLKFGDRLESEELRELPVRIAKAFNGVRFGNAELTDDQANSIGNDLAVFSSALSKRQNPNG